MRELLWYLVKFTRQFLEMHEIVHFDTDAEGDYLAHVTFFAQAKRVREVT